MTKVRHLLGISGGKDSAALAIYMMDKYPQIDMEYYFCDTGTELAETYTLISNLQSYLGKTVPHKKATKGETEETPFDHFLKTYGGYLPSAQARWCTKKMKLDVFEEFVNNDPVISYVGIRGDEEREGYVSTKPNIQTIFPFRRNIWSLDVINLVLNNDNINKIYRLYVQFAPDNQKAEILQTVEREINKSFYYSKKLNALLDFGVSLFNKVVFEFLKTTDYPIGKLDSFPLIENEDVIGIKDVFDLLEKSGVGKPAYYKPIEFEVDGKIGTYHRSRSGCYFCFYQQKIEWVWLLEQHPDLYKKAMTYEKDGYTWMDNESLADLRKPARVRQIKLDYLKKTEAAANNYKSNKLVDIFGEVNCVNCFI